MKRCRRFQAAGLADQGLLVGRPMGAAFERRDVETRRREHLCGKLHMLRLAGMGGAGKRQFPVAETVGVGRTAFHQGQPLHRLAGGARENGGVSLTERKDGPAIAVDGDHKSAMATFDEVSAGDFDENGIRHALPSNFRNCSVHLAGILSQETEFS
ncbi:hypothetical protein D9M72_459010 [compost metagenome]